MVVLIGIEAWHSHPFVQKHCSLNPAVHLSSERAVELADKGDLAIPSANSGIPFRIASSLRQSRITSLHI